MSTATAGKAGLQIAAIETPDVLVVDLSMPNMTGLKMIAELRRKTPKLDHPMILLSASVSDSSRRGLRRLGVSNILEKPFESAALIDMVDQAMNRRIIKNQVKEIAK